MKFLSIVILFVLVAGCSDENSKSGKEEGDNSEDEETQIIFDTDEIGQKTSMKITKVFDAGDRIKGEKIYAEFQVENTGRYPLVFGEIKGSCSCTVAEKPEAPILPGRKGVIKAVVDTEKFDRGYQLNKMVTVMANTDPNVVKLSIIGTIK